MPRPDAAAAASDIPRPAAVRPEGRSDAVIATCSAPIRAADRSLADLQTASGSTEPDVQGTVYGGAVVLAHSTALSGELVSELNPRAIITTARAVRRVHRGMQQVEIAAPRSQRRSASTSTWSSSSRPATPPRRLQPGRPVHAAHRVGLGTLTLRRRRGPQEHALRLSAVPSARPTDKPVLLMRELDGPWTHFFGPDQDEPPGFPGATGSDAAARLPARQGRRAVRRTCRRGACARTVGFTLQNLVTRPAAAAASTARRS